MVQGFSTKTRNSSCCLDHLASPATRRTDVSTHRTRTGPDIPGELGMEHGAMQSIEATGKASQIDSKPTNPKDAQATTRIDLSLFPGSARAYGALGMAEGDLKYGGFNYRAKGVRASVYYAALGRHMDKWFYCGEDFDQKTGVPHLANAIACIAILIDAVEQGNMNDDRPPAQSPELYERLERHMAKLQAVFERRVERYRAAPYPWPPKE